MRTLSLAFCLPRRESSRLFLLSMRIRSNIRTGPERKFRDINLLYRNMFVDVVDNRLKRFEYAASRHRS